VVIVSETISKDGHPVKQIVNEIFTIVNVSYDRKIVKHMKRLEPLKDYVRRIRTEKRLSLSEVSRNSGNKIASSYLHRIENGNVVNVSPLKLKALAKGLGVSEEEVFNIVRGIRPREVPILEDEEVALILTKYQKLSEEEKRELVEIFSFLEKEIDRRLQKRRKTRD
jgi:transcriptional regulator with XRE-family HTH domain